MSKIAAKKDTEGNEDQQLVSELNTYEQHNVDKKGDEEIYEPHEEPKGEDNADEVTFLTLEYFFCQSFYYFRFFYSI